MLRLNKDLAHLLFKDLSLKDLENLYKAEGITKQFVEKNFLKDGCIIKFKVKDENTQEYNNLLNLLGESNSSIIFKPNGIIFLNRNINIEINLKNDFFKEYFCSVSLNVLDFSIPSIQSSDLLRMEILEYSVSIENTKILNISKENADWSFINEKYINICDRIPRIEFPIISDVNIIIDKNIMRSFIELLNSPNRTLFSVSNNILEIKRDGKAIKRKLIVELDKNFKSEFPVNKIHALQFLKSEINFMLSESFMMIQSINNKFELKILRKI